MLQQLDVSIRHPLMNFTQFPERIIDLQLNCNKGIMDQAFHHVIIYTKQLSRFINIKHFPQGEGTINTIGGYKQEKALIKMNLTEWQIVKGTRPNITIHNWNGDVSPVVHQYDKYL